MGSGNTFFLEKVGGLGLNKSVFWINCEAGDIKGLPWFYRSVLKAWSLVKTVRTMPVSSLHWLLEDPLVKGARLDVAGQTMPGMMRILVTAKMITLRRLLEVAGNDLDNVNAVAQSLGLQSQRVVVRFLDNVKKTLE